MTGAVRAVKLDGECDEVHAGLTRHHVKFPVTMNAELHHVYRTSDPHAAALRRHFSSSMEPFSSVDGAVCAEKVDGDCDEVHKGLNRHHVKSPVRTNGELYQVYRTWGPPRRCIEATFQ